MQSKTPHVHTPWMLRAETEIFARKPFVTVVQQSVTLHNGQVIDDFYQVHLRSFALCVPVLRNGNIQLIRQYKHGPGKICLSFPAGFIENGEDPEVAAKRELLEETGIAPGEILSLGTFVDNGNQRGCKGHYFLATGCSEVAAPAPGDLEEFEYLELSPTEVDLAVQNGAFAVIHHAAAWGLARMRVGL